jgi:hypothetical protein
VDQPPVIESEPLPPVLEKKRYHDLDALRACAMLLGIVMHGILAFGEPGWEGYAPQNDAHWDVPAVITDAAAAAGAEAPEKFSPYKFCSAAIHGFRMPLFFLVSGFFTAMLWRTRGTKELLKHRAKRILLPLAIFTPIAWITMLGGMGIGTLGAKVFFDDKRDARGAAQKAHHSITDAVVAGDLKVVEGHLKRGADIKQTNDKGETLLHIAAFFAHPEVVQLLLDKGLDPAIKSKKGQAALNYVEDPWNREIEGTYKFVGGLIGLDLDLERIKRDRPKCAAILRKQGTPGSRSPPAEAREPDGPLKKFKYRAYYQQFNTLPDFDKLTPQFSGKSEKGIIDLGLAERKETFGMVFEGELEVKEAGDFKFRLGSDDGSRLILNGKELIDNDGTHGMEYKEGSVNLEPGMAKIRVDYFDWGGGQGLSLSVSGPGIKELSDGKDELLLSKEKGKERGEEFMREVKTWIDEKLGEVPEWAIPLVVVIGVVGGILFFGGMVPVFLHLWFLYYLIWLVIGFVLVAWIAKKRKIKPWPAWVIASPWRWLWLVPFTLVPQLCFWQSFGPDTFIGIIPWPPKILYYAVFFGFGALCYGHEEFEIKVGRYWYLSFFMAIPVLLLGGCWLHMREKYGFKPEIQLVLSLCIVIYTWLMIFGCIGFFRAFFSSESRIARYISDSSYWLYLAHLAPLMCLQVMLSKWDIPSFPKFIFYCVFTTGILLLIYEFIVRYTFIGTLLNGKRTRESANA